MIGAGIVALDTYRQPDVFSRSAPYLRHHPEWDILPLAADEQTQITQILSQPFHYLAAGSQSYAFASDDGKYVIKFFRMKKLIPRPTHYFRPQKIANRNRNLHLLFNAYKLVYERFRKETGVLFVHLNTTKDLNTTLSVRDREQVEHLVNLDEFRFVIQEKAEILHSRIHRLKVEQRWEELEKASAAFLALVQKRIDAGITDLDNGIDQNYGFVGDRPIHIDVGRVCVGQQAGEYERISALLDRLVEGI